MFFIRRFSQTLFILCLPSLLFAQHPPIPAPPETHAPMLRQGQCVSCHQSLDEERLTAPAKSFLNDKHGQTGLSCAICHGGDPTAFSPMESHDPSKGFIAQPQPSEIVKTCAVCHANPEYMRTQNPAVPTDQYEKYWTSKHGQLLTMGLRKVATCVSCHTPHNVRPANDPLSSVYPTNLPHTCAHCHADEEYMAGFPIPTDQFAKYAASVHGQALLESEDIGAPACNDCHGNHGAVPPGVESLAHVCGTCHSMNADLYESSDHYEVFVIQERPHCVVCHDYHAIPKPTHETFSMNAASVCIDCHKKDDQGWKTGKEIYNTYQDIAQIQSQAEEEVEKAQKLGMDVSDARFVLQDFRKNYLQLQTLTHALDVGQFEEKAAETIDQAMQAKLIATEAVDEYHYRRKGLGLSLLLSLPVIVLMWLKIRSLKY